MDSGRLAATGVICLLLALLTLLILPSVQSTRKRGRSPCKNSLKQIGLALHNYHDTYHCFPPAYVADETGKPMHSWRVLVLPYLDDNEQSLYERYDFSVPWDDPRNAYVLNHMPEVFSCYVDPDRGGKVTSYLAPFGPNCVFRGSEPTRIRDITDGSSNTVIVGEAWGLHVPWTKPQDIDIAISRRIGEPRWFGGHDGGARFLFADGSVRLIFEANASENTLQNLFERNDGNVIPEF